MTKPAKVDVVIVGAGAAGSVLAAKLAQAGKRVVVLEAGPPRTQADLYSSQIWARRVKWGGPPVLSGGTHPVSHNFNAGWGFGGAAAHHYACWFRLHAQDFKVSSLFGKGVDWPIEYDQLRPFYDQIQREVGVSGDTKGEVWRPKGEPYPMPALTGFRHGEIIASGFTKLGMRTALMPHAINSTAYMGRPACLYDGWCDAGCPIGALANPLAVYLAQARAASAELRAHSHVTRVLTNARGDRATGVEYYDSKGMRQVQEATAVILAAFTVQTPRILLNSVAAGHPRGLANSSGLVGHYLHVHISGSIFGLFNEDTQNTLGVTGGSHFTQDRYEKDPKRGFVGSYQWLIATALKPNNLLGIANARTDLFGEELHTFMHKAVRGLGTMALVGESIPLSQNRVELSKEKDPYGFPLARAVHSFGPDALALYEHTKGEGLSVFKAAGATQAWAGRMAQQHIMGGVIMGDSPERSVTNSYGRAHDLPNLFIAGPSTFPSPGAVNPTFTIHALAVRTAGHLLKNWSSLT